MKLHEVARLSVRCGFNWSNCSQEMAGPSGELTAIRVYLRDGTLYWERQGPSGESQTVAARPCAEDAILVGEGDGQRMQFLTDRDGEVWALFVGGGLILRKVE